MKKLLAIITAAVCISCSASDWTPATPTRRIASNGKKFAAQIFVKGTDGWPDRWYQLPGDYDDYDKAVAALCFDEYGWKVRGFAPITEAEAKGNKCTCTCSHCKKVEEPTFRNDYIINR